jgi:N-acyl-D-amino-acid deacylase
MLDLLIRGGRVADGTGGPLRRADVGVRDGRIVEVAATIAQPAAQLIDAGGLVVAPGFIDMHAHSELSLLREPDHLPKVAQGVTLELLGQDGLSYAPIDDDIGAEIHARIRGWHGQLLPGDPTWGSVSELLDRLDGAAISVAYLVPHGNVRALVLGFDDRVASAAEIAQMGAIVSAGIEQGAFGLSTGLTYAPAMFADDEELVSLCRVVAERGGIYVPHHRNYGARAIEAFADCVRIARESGVALHLAHTKLGYAADQGRAPELLDLIDGAAAAGQDVTLDSYPYLAGSSYLHALLPGWIQGGGTAAVIERLRDPGSRSRLRTELEVTGSDGAQGIPADWSTIVLSGVTREEHRRYVGRSIADVAALMDVDPFDAYVGLLVDEQLGATCIIHVGNEENVRSIMASPRHMVGSDGLLVGERPHPRAYGTFPRLLGRYVRDLGILTLAEMVRHMTSAPAARLGLSDRGMVREGFAADLVCFDPDRIADRATYEDPRQLPEGIPHVAVNGQLVIHDSRHTGRLPGVALRHRAPSKRRAARDPASTAERPTQRPMLRPT